MSQETEIRTTGARRMGAWVIRAAIVLAALFGIAGNISRGVALSLGRPPINLGTEPLPGLPLDRLPILLQAELREGATGTVEDSDLVLRLLNIVPLFLEALTVVVAAWLLLRVLSRVAAREAFSTQVVSRWRALTGVLLAGGLLTGLINSAAFLYLNWNLGLLGMDRGLDPEERDAFLGGDYMAVGIDVPHWPIPVIIAGLVALALTAAFRAGAQLERDVDGVI
ncbi:DUF2975 domain-containing protein [Nesterenkonia populi]|uniref:DUF2975 domain-containing protein n=1 Tax=Nesterenkonia populi TaxID=1591087 RepID=UPI0011BED36A|nr:DUF2975 domain-containing protein [Nesterenkonia populi]